MTLVECWTDGSCRNVKDTPQPTGCGCVLRVANYTYRIATHGRPGTNNTAELSAIRLALYLVNLKDPSVEMEVFSDSEWAVKCLRGEYGFSKNTEIFAWILQRIRACSAESRVRFTHVRGHAGTPENEQADMLANMGRESPETGQPYVVLAELWEHDAEGVARCLLTSDSPERCATVDAGDGPIKIGLILPDKGLRRAN